VSRGCSFFVSNYMITLYLQRLGRLVIAVHLFAQMRTPLTQTFPKKTRDRRLLIALSVSAQMRTPLTQTFPKKTRDRRLLIALSLSAQMRTPITQTASICSSPPRQLSTASSINKRCSSIDLALIERNNSRSGLVVNFLPFAPPNCSA
jgi:hypothetical protein